MRTYGSDMGSAGLVAPVWVDAAAWVSSSLLPTGVTASLSWSSAVADLGGTLTLLEFATLHSERISVGWAQDLDLTMVVSIRFDDLNSPSRACSPAISWASAVRQSCVRPTEAAASGHELKPSVQ